MKIQVLPKTPRAPRCGLVKITGNNWKPKNEQSQFLVVAREFDKPAAFLAVNPDPK
jgi:hypothetical protein